MNSYVHLELSICPIALLDKDRLNINNGKPIVTITPKSKLGLIIDPKPL